MTGYQYTIPNSTIHSVAIKIQNNGDIVNGIYSGAGVFVDNGDGNKFPLCTVGKDDLQDLPANSVIYIYNDRFIPVKFRENCRIIVDSTAIPNTCLMTPMFLLEVED